MEVMKPLAVLLLLTTQPAENDDFNCPQQKGKLEFEEAWVNALPGDVSSLWPEGVTVDFVCSVDDEGRLTSCKFAVRPTIPAMSAAIERSILSAMQRMVRYIRSDTPNQRCVASKLKFEFKETVMPS